MLARNSRLLVALLLISLNLSFTFQTPKCRLSNSKYRPASSLASSPSQANPTASPTSDSSKQRVIYQRVLRPSAVSSDNFFLSSVVAYLQDAFTIPDRLPMVYTKHLVEDDNDHTLLRIDSPLSPSPSSTAMFVEVVGIYTGGDETVPDMAMVVVKKDAPSKNSLPPMMKGLFGDSEKRILKALDVGLEEFITGQVRVEPAQRPSSFERAQSNLLEELGLDDEHVDDPAPTAEPESTESLQAKREAVLATMKRPVDRPVEQDFAVAAARRYREDVTVAAARRAAQKRRDSDNSNNNEAVAEDEPVEEADPVSIDLSQVRPPALDNVLKGRAFGTCISKPGDYQATSRRKRKLNLTVKENTKEVDPLQSALEKATEDQPRDYGYPSDADLQEEIIKASQKALEDMASDENASMTPEELLDSVIQFGDQKKAELRAGSGFVSGAFEKAKELLRLQKEQRDERLRNSIASRVAQDVKQTASGLFSEEPAKDVKELSPDEELRRMFEAGERLADSRIAMVAPDDLAQVASSEQDEKAVDRLIAGEKTVSAHARIIDEELAELEIRINKSPGEELDGPRRSPMFDILSGPEMYNPNVDPEEAVNWPGAMPGTRDMKLPKELGEAVKQAEFAAQVLRNLQESGDQNAKHFKVGSLDLSEQQVRNLQLVLRDAVDIGLIADPLELMAERSRLQMLVDELWTQPEERVRDVASSYRDLLLSDNFVCLVKERLNAMADRDLDALRRDDDSLEEFHYREREILSQLVVYVQLLLKETRALGAELEAQQIEIIRSICKVAMDPSHRTEEETAMALGNAVRDMRPLLDDAFVAYLKYAVSEEEGRLARAGLLDDPEHNQWLFVLKIVQQGIYAELSRGINRYIDHIWYVLRMETPKERFMLLKKLIDVMPTLDVRPFVQVVDNIVGSLGDAARGEFDEAEMLGGLTNKLIRLRKDVHELLPAERIAIMSRDADDWAAKRKEQLLEQRRMTKQRLEASRTTEHLDEEVDSIGRRGEIERVA